MLNSNEWLTSLPDPKGKLKEVQVRGRKSLPNIDSPSKKNEIWRLTNLDRLKAIFDLPIAFKGSESEENRAEYWPDSPEPVFRISLDPNEDSIESIKLPEGIRLLNNNEIEQILGHVVNRCECNNNWLVTINKASSYHLLALKIQGRSIPPLEIIMPSYRGRLSSTRVLIILEENTELDLLQVFLGTNNSAHSNITEIHLDQEAKLNHGVIADGDGSSSLMGQILVEQKTRSEYYLTNVLKGLFLGRLEPYVVQSDGKAKTSLRGLQISNKLEQIGTYSNIRFDGPEGDLDQLQKAVATDSSHCVFNGQIIVPRHAQRTNASQLSRNLLLSSRARIDTKPELAIVADDVRCTHGATVSQLQDEELFYMRSRGISIKESMQMLLKGYCEDVLSSLPLKAKRWFEIDQLITSSKEST